MAKTFPNEGDEYRAARDRLLKEEQAVVDKVKALAALRRSLPPGGALKEDYVFQWATAGKLGQRIRFSELFGDKRTLIVYSFMFGPTWDKPCLSCTSLMDGFDRASCSVTRDAAFVAVAKAPPERIHAFAKQRGWSGIDLLSGYESTFQADYKCQGADDDAQRASMLVFQKRDGKIHHFWASELSENFVDTVWVYWNLMDFTPEGRPDWPVPPQAFRSQSAEKYMTEEERRSLAPVS
jgi:predicted dithiol-disulfide oxidoreductase (DUF899 family)